MPVIWTMTHKTITNFWYGILEKLNEERSWLQRVGWCHCHSSYIPIHLIVIIIFRILNWNQSFCHDFITTILSTYELEELHGISFSWEKTEKKKKFGWAGLC